MTAARACAIVALVGLAACDRGEAQLEDVVGSAAVEAGVPAELLLAISYVESRATLAGAGQWIRLMAWRRARDPRRGAQLIGVSPDALADPVVSLRAAAALLAAAADEAGVRRDAPLDAWRPALERFSGGHDALANQLFADQVLAVLDQGASATGAAWPPRPPQLVGASFASYVPLSDGAHRPLSATGRRPRFIIIHTMENTLPVIVEYFRNPATHVGAHYLVDSVAGTTIQMADERLVVFHDACFNDDSIGIEHEGYVEAGRQWYSDAELRASARLVRDIARRYDIPLDRQHVLGHGDAPDCSDHSDPGVEWDWSKYMAYVARAE